MTRKLLPRPPVVVAPLLVSQLNSLAVAGIDARRFLELVRDCKLAHGRRGKLVFVSAEVLREALAGTTAAEKDATVDDVDDVTGDDPRSVDDVLRLIGRRAT